MFKFTAPGVVIFGFNEQAASLDKTKAPYVKVGDIIVEVDPRYFRPAEVATLLGDPSKAREKLGWTPEITCEQMCAEMVANDLKIAKQNNFLKKHGYWKK